MLLRLVEEHTACLVAWESVILIAVPQPAYDADEFLGTLVAIGVVEMLLAAVIAGGTFKPGRDDVPARTAAADEVERPELAGDIVGFPI
jgi:hypothetical protein